jgi:hypothetical protein
MIHFLAILYMIIKVMDSYTCFITMTTQFVLICLCPISTIAVVAKMVCNLDELSL